MKSFAQGDAHVFHGGVLVHVQVALGAQLQVEGAVAGKKLQHVVEKADAGGNVIASLAFNGERQFDVRLRGGAVKLGLSHGSASGAASGPGVACGSVVDSEAGVDSVSGAACNSGCSTAVMREVISLSR